MGSFTYACIANKIIYAEHLKAQTGRYHLHGDAIVIRLLMCTSSNKKNSSIHEWFEIEFEDNLNMHRICLLIIYQIRFICWSSFSRH